MTGSAIAIPLLGAGAASATDAGTWDRVANCESGGVWSADYGNGYYGGLQLSQQDWEQHGGTAYAPRPDLASRSQQIAVAEKLLAAEGSAAWESCAVVTGLVMTDTAPEVDPGDLDRTLGSGGEVDPPTFGDGADAVIPEPAAPDSASVDPATGSDSGSPDASAGASESAQSPSGGVPDGGGEGADGSADSAQGAGDGTGRHRGEAADEGEVAEATEATEEDEAGETGNSGDESDSGRHASRGDTSTRDGVGATGAYTVRAGDSLSSIADAHQVPGGWPALFDGNREVVGTDADLILPGQSLDLGLERE
ncbi:transglycosylase family protein [Streptomyces sp. SCSIO 30461]|uniref:transglycosylase family protein n=1 Tax=Streptomyces sp. SCSIO 30461 TaxID=3118085 RepID=UPI0030D43D59